MIMKGVVLSSIVIPSQGLPVAVYFKTESGDRYNSLLIVNGVEDFMKKVEGVIGEELAHVCDFEINTNHNSIDLVFKNSFRDARNDAYDEYERKWQEENQYE